MCGRIIITTTIAITNPAVAMETKKRDLKNI
jgi:hypothetical protein